MQGSVPLPDFFGHQGYHQWMNYLNKPSYFFIYSHILTRSAKPLTVTMVCLIENSLICIAVYRNARLRSSTNLYIISLAISDIINAIIVMPFTVGVLITGEWPFGEAVCDFHAFFTLFSVYVSPTTMGLTAFNRYVRIVKPQHYPRIFTDTRSKIYIGAVWLTVAGYVFNSQDGRLDWISLLRWIRRLYRWATHHSHEDSSLYYCRLFFRSCSTRSCISFLLQGLRENKTSQSKHGFDGPRRGKGKSIDCQRDQAYQIARHCCVCLCTVLDSILDHCDDTALRFWCRSTQYPTALSLFDVLLEHYKPIYTRAEFRRILLYKAKSSQFCEELRRPKDVELKKIFEKRPWHRKSRRRGKYLSQGSGGQRSDWTKSKGSQ